MPHAILRAPRLHQWLRDARPFLHDAFLYEWRAGWSDAIEDASARGRVEELHAARGDYQAAFKATLQIMGGLLVLADLYDGHGGQAERLRRVRDDFQRLHDEIFGDWHSLADLERKMVAAFSRPNAELIAAATASPPPDWWWTDDDDLREPAGGGS